MDLKEKRKQEIDRQKEHRKEQIIKAAIAVFKEKGIENAKMIDVAKKAEFGVATVYRYFNTKTELVIASGAWLWDDELRHIHSMLYEEDLLANKAIHCVEKTLNLFLDMYHNHADILGFLEQFDNYVVKENIPPQQLIKYEASVITIKEDILEAIALGKVDGSIKPDIDENLFYITATHALMSLCQKLTLRGKIISKDDEIDGYLQIKFFIEALLGYIRQ
jgi:AcrR family transcriptional regulator